VPNVDVVFDMKVSRGILLTVKNQNKGARFIHERSYYQVKFEQKKFLSFPSAATMLSADRIYIDAQGVGQENKKDKTTATFFLKQIEVTDLVNDPRIEISIAKNAFTPSIKDAYLEVRAIDIKNGREYRRTCKNFPFGRHMINIIGNIDEETAKYCES
jgi:hypothetical protein